MANFTVVPANVAFSSNARFVYGTAGEALSLGEVVFMNDDGHFNDARANNLNNAGSHVHGICATESAAEGQPVQVCVYDPVFTPGFTMSVGEAVVLSRSGRGFLSPAADLTNGSAALLMLWPLTTTTAFLNPVLARMAHN